MSAKIGPRGYSRKSVRILGIESSCDETAAAVVADGERVLSSVVASQLTTHGKYGGVVPELASREHLRAIVPVVREALEHSDTALGSLAAVAVTVGPGLVGSLLVGITYAKALAFSRGLPLIGVNHIEGHIHAVVLEARGAWPNRGPTTGWPSRRGRLDAAYLERWAARLGAEGQVPNALYDCRLRSISPHQTTRTAI
jgi:hypothetical protein